MADLVKLEEELLTHDLESAHLTGVLLLSKKDLAIATLTDLCQDLEVAVAKSHASLAKVGSLASRVFSPHLAMSLLVGLGGLGIFGLESSQSILSRANVGEKIKVIIEEVWTIYC